MRVIRLTIGKPACGTAIAKNCSGASLFSLLSANEIREGGRNDYEKAKANVGDVDDGGHHFSRRVRAKAEARTEPSTESRQQGRRQR
jgi:hypothetical protein